MSKSQRDRLLSTKGMKRASKAKLWRGDELNCDADPFFVFLARMRQNAQKGATSPGRVCVGLQTQTKRWMSTTKKVEKSDAEHV